MFISKFNSGLSLVWSTLLGHSETGIKNIEVNSKGEVYLLGESLDYTMVASPSPLPNAQGLVPVYTNGTAYFETPASNDQRLLIAKFDGTSYNLMWSTMLHSRYNGYTYLSPEKSKFGLVIDGNDKVFGYTKILM
ncbi:MAG: hypothetical protein QM642_00340 [Edaphocola sp.]